jgi:hypothetical protein
MPQNKRYRVKQREVIVTEYFVWAQDEEDACDTVGCGLGEADDQHGERLPDGLDEWEVEEAPVE